MSGALAVGRSVVLFATRGVCRARGVVASRATNSSSIGQPAAPGASPTPTRRSLTIARGKKKGFAEMLGDLAAPKDTGDFQGRPRLTKGKVTAKQHVPPHIAKPPYADSGFLPDMNENPQIHDAEQIEMMKKAGRLAAEVLDFAESIAKPGVTTDYIDQKVHKMIIDAGAYPSPLNYGGFPKSVCT